MLKYRIDFFVLLYVLLLVGIKISLWLMVSGWLIPSILISSLASFYLLTIRHNHSHLPIFKSKSLNLTLDFLFNVFGGFSSHSIRIIHNINHHSTINTVDDWGRTDVVSGQFEIVKMIKYTGTTVFNFMKNQSKFLEDKPDLKRKVSIEIAIVWAVYILLLIVRPFPTLVFLIIPLIFAQLLVVWFNYLQHNNCATGNKYTHSRNFTGTFLNVLTCNNGFHTIHHMYPAKHWSKYPEAHESINHLIPEELNQKSLFSYLWKTMVISKKRKRVASPEL